ncbi:MAG: HigA family addiction module antidote protein [Treponema sp.]|jgi:addiction module HigA family antidote|nr:HigA family addiction module antidote protein [Treponema sp.]
MAKTIAKEPGIVLRSFIEKYHLNPSQLAAAVKLSQSTIRQITLSKMKISVPVALRFAKFFGNPVEFWTKLQMDYDLEQAAKDKSLAATVKKIEKVKKQLPSKKEGAAAKKGGKAKTGAKKRTAKKPAVPSRRSRKPARSKKV